ncbi:Fe-S cluster assembly scaffold SufA, partial [Klebsiella aerogenes]
MELQTNTFNPDDFNWQGLTMTPAAAAHIRDLMHKQPDKQGLRLGIKTSGCAGFGYVLEMIAEPADDDLLFERDGAKLFAPLQAMPFI